MLLLLVLFLPFSLAQDCSRAPPRRRRICEQISMWDSRSRTVNPAVQTVSAPGFSSLASIPMVPRNAYSCMTIGCLCGFFGGTGGDNCVLANGQPLGKAVRTEYRVLSDDDRQRYNAAMWTIKNNGDYDDLSRIHSNFQMSPGAHSGPAFVPWHREFIKRLEIALRRVDPGVALPYWDSVMDNNLPNPVDSILWGNELMGSPDLDMQVRTGAFRNWPTVDRSRGFQRSLGTAQNTLYTELDISLVLGFTDVHGVLAFTAAQRGCPYPAPWDAVEYTHGSPHNFVGGDMLVIIQSTNDPIFFNHHSFVDLIWETWRTQQQTRTQRENDYPPSDPSCSSSNHYGDNTMQPFFPMVNTDGLSNQYTDNLYSYAPRPSCAFNNVNGCGSRFLFCDLSHGNARCSSKIQIGGDCSGYSRNEDRCYQGVCIGNRCQMASTQTPTTQPPVVTMTPAVPSTDGTCFNEQECCQPWASTGECQRNSQYMTLLCQAACGVCQPNYNANVECNDRHSMCSPWAQRGECTNNPSWMNENCRQSCGRCGVTRLQACSAAATTTTTPAPQVSSCLNNHYCCVPWAINNYCFSNPAYMLQYCASACGICIGPANWNPLACVDFHPSCPAWTASGECSINPNYMLENCRASCRRCDLLNVGVRLRACGFQSARSRFLNSIKPKSLQRKSLPPSRSPSVNIKSKKQRTKTTTPLGRTNQAKVQPVKQKNNKTNNNKKQNRTNQTKTNKKPILPTNKKPATLNRSKQPAMKNEKNQIHTQQRTMQSKLQRTNQTKTNKKSTQQRAKQQRTTNKKTATLNRWKHPVKNSQKKP